MNIKIVVNFKRNLYIKIQNMTNLYLNCTKSFPVCKKKQFQVRQLTYVAYVLTFTFIDVRMILDMCTLTRTLIFSLWFYKVFKIFQVLIILNCLKSYCYIFDLQFICLSLEETTSLLFTFALNKLYFPFFHTNYLINIYPYLRGLANLGCD